MSEGLSPLIAFLAKHYQLYLSRCVLFVQDPSNWLASSNIQCLALAPRTDKVGTRHLYQGIQFKSTYCRFEALHCTRSYSRTSVMPVLLLFL